LHRILSHPFVLRLISFGVVLGAWEYAGRTGMSAAFPSFSETVAAWLALAADGSLPKALAITLSPLIIGVLISAFAGVAIGLVMGLSRRAEWLGVPLFIVLQAAPLDPRLWCGSRDQGRRRLRDGCARDRAQFLQGDPPHAGLAFGDG
jgi:NitT/TauT family transport system permease protein